jgi:hypothetical protein
MLASIEYSTSPTGALAAAPQSCTSQHARVTLTPLLVLAQSAYTPDVRLYHRAVVVAQEAPLRGLVRQLSIDQLDNEGRRVSIYENRGERTPLFTRSMSVSVSCCARLRQAVAIAVSNCGLLPSRRFGCRQQCHAAQRDRPSLAAGCRHMTACCCHVLSQLTICIAAAAWPAHKHWHKAQPA